MGKKKNKITVKVDITDIFSAIYQEQKRQAAKDGKKQRSNKFKSKKDYKRKSKHKLSLSEEDL